MGRGCVLAFRLQVPRHNFGDYFFTVEFNVFESNFNDKVVGGLLDRGDIKEP